MQFLLALSYFDRKMGPCVFYSYPEYKLKEENASIIANLMDQIISEGFFTHSFNSFYTINYYFEIDSEWARGKKEFLMISIIFKQPVSIETEKALFTLCIEFIEWLKAKKDIFSAFYFNTEIDNQKYHNDIEYNFKLIIDWVQEFYFAIEDEIQNNLKEFNISSLLEKQEVLETLKLLSEKPLPIRELKTWYSKDFPHNNFNHLITTLFKCYIVYIPKIGGRKEAPFNVHLTKEFKTIIKLVVLKNKLIKEFIKSHLSKAIQDLEKNSKEFHKFLERVFSEKQVI
ncbi:MAG: hypothetical protein ACFFEO_04560 [Candidatus Thorarchaeota archaeon]